MANQTLAAYSLVAEGLIARKSEASPCVVRMLTRREHADTRKDTGVFLLRRCEEFARNYARTLSPEKVQ